MRCGVIFSSQSYGPETGGFLGVRVATIKLTHYRRFTRLTNAFSKKVENHAAAIALHTFYYNFVRIHQTLKVTPAMAAGVTEKLWEMDDLVAMLEQWELANAFCGAVAKLTRSLALSVNRKP